jgi:hypothetical protein
VGEIFRELVNIAKFFLNIYIYIFGEKGSWCNIQGIGEYCTLFLFFYFSILVGKGSVCNIQGIGEYCTLSVFFFSLLFIFGGER